jgi:hypothetical protein
LLVALVDAVTLATSAPPRAPMAARGAAQAQAALHLVAVGLVVTLSAAALRRTRWPDRLLRSIAAGVVTALAYFALGDDLSGIVEKLPGTGSLVAWTVALSALVAQVVPLAAALGAWLARPWIRLVGVLAAAAIAAVNGRVFPQAYPGLHLLLTAVAATLAGAALDGARWLQRATPSSTGVRLALAGAALAVSGAAIILPPANAAAVILAGQPSAVLAPFIGRVRRERAMNGRIPEDQRPWFTPRDSLPPIPPSEPPLLPPKSVVLMIGIDSLRADVFENPDHRDQIPNLFALKERSTYFARARATASSTAPSIASIFSSRTYSQLYWTRREGTNDPLVYPHLDPTPRFPELLHGGGFETMTVDTMKWLVDEYAIVRGFDETVSRKPNPAHLVFRDIRRRVAELRGEALFVFTHLVDAHYPYGPAAGRGTPFQGYLRQLGLIDREIPGLLRAIERQKIEDRTAIIVYSDHGEAFGEHGLTTHSQGVYEEVLRVPLIIHLPGGKAQVVDERVSLIDLGPTILDLVGVPTPGVYMGQSLVGFLRGERPKLKRPIVAEARLKRSIVTPDGFKVIRDPLAHTIEIFDLDHDPREENNLYVEGSPRSAELLGVLDAFFYANTFKKRGYRVPFRKW